jgi:hypothetical protein
MNGSSPITRRGLIGGVLLAGLSGSALAQGFAGLGESANGFAPVVPRRVFSFPPDHGPHPEFRIEWWYVTGHLGFAENPDTLENTVFGTNSHTIESLSFVSPVAFTLELLLLWSDRSLGVTFGVAAVVGIVAGSFAYAMASRTFRWEGLAGPEDTANHVIGGLLMGFGGVTALGCTIGQGITGLSTLALGSILTFGAIVAGSALTMKYQYWRITRET